MQEGLMVSVIIRNRNEEDYIGFAIQSVLDHFKEPEIIVIDNNSTDSSLEVVSMFRPILKDRLIIKSIDNYSPGAALNEGVRNALNDKILVLSAHAQITTLNIEMLNRWFFRNYVAIFGQQTPIYRGKKITKRYIWSHFNSDITDNMYSKIEDRYFLHNAFCFYDKQFLLDNPFDEMLQGKEDRYWAADIVKKGYKYLYDGNYQKCNHFYTKNGATWKGIG
jgi:glycosyltransferase involved in cell wall biosynthesis